MENFKLVGDKKLYDLFNKYIDFNSKRAIGYNIVINNKSDLLKWFDDVGLILRNETFWKFRDKYPVVCCGFGHFGHVDNKKVYFYCDLKRSRNTYGNDGLYTIKLIYSVVK